MTYEEVNKMIDEYDDSSELGKSIKELLRTIAQRSYEAGRVDGANMITEMMTKVSEELPF